MQKNWNVQFNSNNKRIVVKLTIQNRVAKVDVEPNARSRTYKEVQDTCKMSEKSKGEQQQKWLRTSHSCTTSWLLVLTQSQNWTDLDLFIPQLWYHGRCSASFEAKDE